jgi:23S rRNA (adenine2503-C2)-methyltransferase
VQIVRYLHSRGVLTKVRNSAGQDIDGGCGQLRARASHLLDSRALHRVTPRD